MTFASNLGQPLQTGSDKLLSTQAGRHDRAARMFWCPYVIQACDDIQKTRSFALLEIKSQSTCAGANMSNIERE